MRINMGILNSELNYDLVLTDLGRCCMGEDVCGSCTETQCIVGYAKSCITKCFKEGITYIEDGMEHIPFTDFKVFNVENFESGIAHILRQCRSCKENHFENCIINIIRSCYEIGLFGETQNYEGSAFRYLNQIHNSHPETAAAIIELFHALQE